MVDSEEDHDLLIRIKQLLSSVTEELEKRFSREALEREKLEIALQKIDCEVRGVATGLAVSNSNIEHITKNVEQYKKDLDGLKKDVDDKLKEVGKTIDDAIVKVMEDNDKRTKNAVETSRNNVGMYIAIAAIVAGLVGTVVGFVLA